MITNELILIENVANGFVVRPFKPAESTPANDKYVFCDLDTMFAFLKTHFVQEQAKSV